ELRAAALMVTLKRPTTRIAALDNVRGFAENPARRNKSEVSPSLAARPKHSWLPVHLLPCALKSKRICAGGLPLLLRIGIAMRSNWCPRAFRKWMLWWGDCRAGR